MCGALGSLRFHPQSGDVITAPGVLEPNKQINKEPSRGLWGLSPRYDCTTTAVATRLVHDVCVVEYFPPLSD